MKVLMLCTSTLKDTARGIDRYASSLSAALQKTGKVDLTIQPMQHGLPYSMAAFAYRELTSPLRLLRTKADVYHAISPFVAKTAIFARKAPLVTSFHDLIPYKNALTHFYVDAHRRYLYSRLSFWLAKHSQVIVVPFEITKQDMITTLKVSPGKIRKVPLGVDTDFFQRREAPELKDKAKGRKIVLSILGDICEEKGVSFLLKSFALVGPDTDSELWVGGRWVDQPLFERLLTELKLKDWVKHVGFIPEEKLPAYYSAADICVLPSRQGFSLPILEAMACGTPVVAPDTADIQEVVGETGLLVNPTDVSSLAQAMRKLLSDEGLRTRLSQQAYQKVQSYSWDRVAQETLKVYEELCA